VSRTGRRAINLAETLNFTAAARLSGVSQPSLTRAVRRLEEELGGSLIYRDGADTPKLRELYLGWCGENGFEPIAIGAAA
jgi:Bacterial regulatory helix-turn-helix protein, lysR family